MVSATAQSNLVRRMMMQNPDVTLEQIHAEWDRLGFPKTKRPDNQAMHTAKYTIKAKYVIGDLDDLPRNNDNSLDVVGLIRLLLKKNPDTTEKMMVNYLDTEGIEMTHHQWLVANGKAVPTPAPAPETTEEAPPRARHVGVNGRPPGSRNAVKTPTLAEAKQQAQRCDHMETMLVEARALQHPELVEELRKVRRIVIVRGHELSQKKS